MPGQSSTQPNDDEIVYLTILLGIIGEQNWKTIGYAILENPNIFQLFCQTIA